MQASIPEETAQTCARERRESRLGEKAQAGACNGAGLAGHRAAEALALERGGQVHFAAIAEQAGKELHDTSPCIEVTRGAFA